MATLKDEADVLVAEHKPGTDLLELPAPEGHQFYHYIMGTDKEASAASLEAIAATRENSINVIMPDVPEFVLSRTLSTVNEGEKCWSLGSLIDGTLISEHKNAADAIARAPVVAKEVAIFDAKLEQQQKSMHTAAARAANQGPQF